MFASPNCSFIPKDAASDAGIAGAGVSPPIFLSIRHSSLA